MSRPRGSVLGLSGLAARREVPGEAEATETNATETATQRDVGPPPDPKPRNRGSAATRPSRNGAPVAPTTTQRDVGPAPAPPPPPPDEEEAPAEPAARAGGAGRGKTIYFHPNDEERIDDLAIAVKQQNRRQKAAGGEFVPGAIGGSLFARLGILLAAELKNLNPERFYELVKRVANGDPDDL